MQVIELTLNFMSPFVSKITLCKQLFSQGNRLKTEIIKLVENKTEMYLFILQMNWTNARRLMLAAVCSQQIVALRKTSSLLSCGCSHILNLDPKLQTSSLIAVLSHASASIGWAEWQLFKYHQRTLWFN